jgi:hypothetical protein
MELDEGEAAVGGVDGRRAGRSAVGWVDGGRGSRIKATRRPGLGDDGEAGTIVTDTERTRHGTSWV